MPEEIVKYESETPSVILNALSVSQEQMDDFRIKIQNFTKIINKKPAKVSKHKQGFDYVPIDVLETKLDELFFGLWKDSMPFEPKIVANEIICTCVIEFFHPVAGVWLKRSGIGAAQIRFEANSDIGDITKKIKTALQMDAPHAYAEAFKNACQKIGKSFGKSLRRKEEDTINYTPLLKKVEKKEDEE